MTARWLTLALTLGCTSATSGGKDEFVPGDDSSTTEVSGDTSTTGFDVGTTDGSTGDASCVAVEKKATVVKRPIDFIVMPDESASMGETRDAVANAMQNEVRKALEAAGSDYKVIWHGSWPLPMLAGKVTYNKVGLGSGDGAMFTPVLDTFDAWSPALRADALKVFVHFTDATSGDGGTISGYSGAFDDAIMAKSATLFGTSAARKFTYHAFVGLPVNTPADKPYEPTDPVLTGSCSGSYVNPAPLQELARRNGGYRFPLCRHDLFAGVFDRIAKAAIEGAVLPCEFLVPEPPAGEKLDLSTIALRYKDGTGKEEVFLRAKSAAECANNRFLFDEAARRVTLCPEACTRVKADAKGTITLLSGCDPKIY
jgi:hypothetical protein